MPKQTPVEVVKQSIQKRTAQEMDFDLWKEPDAKATFTFKLRPRLIQVGVNVKLLCCLAGRPTPKVQWFKNSTPISESDHRYSIDYSAGVCTLEIAACSLSDAGTYFCRGENALGSDETSCQLTVEECKYTPPKALLKEQGLSSPTPRQSVVRGPKVEPPKFERKFVNHQLVSIGDIISLRASYSGFPQPHIEWLKNGEPVSPSVNIRNTDFDTCLTLNNVELGDEGEYSCKLTNLVGMEVTKCQVEIEKPKQMKKPIKIIKEPKEPRQPKKESEPELFKESENVKESEPVQEIEKLKESEPVQEIEKLKESEPVQEIEKVKESEPAQEIEKVKESEPIKNSQPAEIVENFVESANKITPNKFGFLKHIQSQNLEEGQPLILEAEVFGKEPLDVIWLRNGKEIPENPDFLKEKKDNFYRLIVSEIFPEDSGVFSVELFSESANKAILSSCSVVVKASDEPELDPKFSKFPKSINIDEGSPVTVNCILDGSRPISLKWYKNNEELVKSKRILFINDENNGNYTLSIPTCLATDSGEYHATASNSNGEVIAAFSLCVSFEE